VHAAGRHVGALTPFGYAPVMTYRHWATRYLGVAAIAYLCAGAACGSSLATTDAGGDGPSGSAGTKGSAGATIRARPVTEPDLIARKLVCAGWSMYASADYLARRGMPPDPETLCGHDVISFDDSLANTPGGTWFAAHAKGCTVAMRGNSVIAVLNAAICGMGVAVIPCFLGGPEPQLRRLTARVLGTRDIHLVVHPDLARVARVRAVMDFIVELFDRDAALWTGVLS
jgi:hypothetical protein